CLDSYIFFFQAEDGIRDRNVTGVQTCALPISAVRYRPCHFPTLLSTAASPARRPVDSVVSMSSGANNGEWFPSGGSSPPNSAGRSEERRVGKECRWGGWHDG